VWDFFTGEMLILLPNQQCESVDMVEWCVVT